MIAPLSDEVRGEYCHESKDFAPCRHSIRNQAIFLAQHIGRRIGPPPNHPPVSNLSAESCFPVHRGVRTRRVAAALENTQETPGQLKRLSLEQLGNVEVTTLSKEPEQVWRTPAAIYVITQEDIRRSGATNVPDICGWRRVWRWHKPTPVHGPLAYAGLETVSPNQFWVLIDGRNVYTRFLRRQLETAKCSARRYRSD